MLGEAKINCGLQQVPLLQSCDSAFLLSFPSPLSALHVLLLLLEVWHPACWPEGSSLIHGILARELSWITQMLVCCWATLLLCLMFFCCESFCFLISPSNEYLFLDYESLFVVSFTLWLWFLASLGSPLFFCSYSVCPHFICAKSRPTRKMERDS